MLPLRIAAASALAGRRPDAGTRYACLQACLRACLRAWIGARTCPGVHAARLLPLLLNALCPLPTPNNGRLLRKQSPSREITYTPWKSSTNNLKAFSVFTDPLTVEEVLPSVAYYGRHLTLAVAFNVRR